MGRVLGAIGKVAGAVGRVVNFIPNQLGKIPVVGKFLKIGASLAMGGLIPGLGWGGMLGKMGGLGSKLGGLAGKLPGAGKALGMASKVKDWGGTVFSSGKGYLAKLPKWGQDVVRNQTKSLPDRLQRLHQQQRAGQEAAALTQYLALQQAACSPIPFGVGRAYFG